MSNDPNDRFMISDLSSKLSAYINGENSDQTLQTRDPAEIGDVLASEIKPQETGRKLPGDELFTDLDQALDPRADENEETARKLRPVGEQKQNEEEARMLRPREEQQQPELQEEQQKLREEQQRQLRLQAEQQRQLRPRQEKAFARLLEESLYSFDLDQPFTSVRSGHAASYEKLSPQVRSMPSEEALRKALTKYAKADKSSQAADSYEAPKPANSYEAPKPADSYEAPKPAEYYKAPPASTSFEAQKAETVFEAPLPETTQSPFEEAEYSSQPSGESRYAESPDPLYRGYQEERKGGSKTAVVISLLIALLALAAMFIIIRRNSSNLANLLSGRPAQNTTDTASKVESKIESAAETESNALTESQIAASMAINEEGEIYHADSQIADAHDSGELVPEDPNDISYIASVNKKAAEDAIVELSEAAPRLYLSAYGIKINAGDSFNALAFVERIEDDTDNKDRLYSDISVDGLDEFDSKVPGTYELSYFCYDSAGNRSNRAKLTVIVE